MIAALARNFTLFTNAALAALVLGAALPGPQRVLAPASWGLVEIAPHVWTDAPRPRRGELLRLVDASRARVAGFFGDAPAHQTVILCSTPSCARAFGVRGNGLSVAFFAVLVSPGGLTEGTLTHELTHSRLHRGMGLRDLLRPPFPTWFDEGLATHVAGHPTWPGRITAQDRAQVRQVRRFWNWDDTYRALGVGRAYVAAAQEVAGIERQAGHAGLLELIARADAGEDFDAVLAEVTARRR